MKKKRKGEIGIVVPMFFITFMVIMIAYLLQLTGYGAIRTMTEDALAMSNLASAVIDIETYGKTHDILIADPEQSFETYQRALQANMKLDAQWTGQGTQYGKVEILDYIVYNVSGSDVEIFRFGQSPENRFVAGGLGSVEAPNGQRIEKTGIYSRVTFPVNGLFGIVTTAVKDKLVDVTN